MAVLVMGLFVLPASAQAITIVDVIELSKAGVSDAVLTALIDADRTVFTLDAGEIVLLQRAGVSEAVTLKMIGTRREFEAAQPPMPELQGPIVVILGERTSAAPPAVLPLVIPYYVPVPLPRRSHRAAASVAPVIGLAIRNGEFVCASVPDACP